MIPYALNSSLGVGTCCCHSDPTCKSTLGMVYSSTGKSFIEGRGPVRQGDIFVGFCGHVSVMVTASTTCFDEGLPQCRMYDSFSGCINGILISNGATKTYTS